MKHTAFSKSASQEHYGILSMEGLKNLPVCSVVEDDALLFMWALSGFLPGAFELVQAWGFRPVTVAFVWVKTYTSGTLRNTMGPYSLPGAELCLLATRGKIGDHVAWHSVKQVCVAPIVKHSRKPDEIRERIDTLVPEGRRLELFARRRTPGWDVFGNDVKDSISLG
jgi:N6-adenosine-specific RNA methylase IME4